MTNTDSELIRLFEQPFSDAERGRARRTLPSFAVSTFVHGFGIAAIAYVLLHNPAIVQRSVDRAYKVRHLDFQMQETPASRAAEEMYPAKTQAPQAKQSKSAAKAVEKQAAQVQPRLHILPPLSLPEGGSGKQMLLQPQIPAKQLLAVKTPVPTVLLWKPEVKPTLKIVPPARNQVTTAEARISIQIPNEEVKLADLPVTATPKITLVPAPAAGTTSPVAVKTPSTENTPPATVSASNDQPTPAAILSISDVHMNVGTAVLPPVNETRGSDHKQGGASQGGSVLNAHVDGAASGSAVTVAGKNQGGTKGSDAGKDPNGLTAASVQKGTDGKGNDGKVNQSASTAGGTSPLLPGETVEHIQLPKDGKFGVIVVGSDLSERYPETLEIWTDRVAYTAYLHVGTPKAWILQYAQLRSTDESSGGAVAKLEAPWPYDIQRPNLLAADVNADALMVHGVLNVSGRLENMAIAYPEGYVHGSFVLRELAQWLFRPALQLGKPTAVEVLLIIPEEVD